MGHGSWFSLTLLLTLDLFYLFFALLFCQHHRSHKSYEENDGCGFEGYQIILIKRYPELSVASVMLHGLPFLCRERAPRNEEHYLASNQQPEPDHPGPEAVRPGGGAFPVNVQEHHDKEVQNQDGSCINDKLNRR